MILAKRFGAKQRGGSIKWLIDTFAITLSLLLTTALPTASQDDNNYLGKIVNDIFFNSDVHRSWFSFLEYLVDEFGFVPKEFFDNGLCFTLILPSVQDGIGFFYQLKNHESIDYAYYFDRLLFGCMEPQDLRNKTYVRSFPGSKLDVKQISNDTVLVGDWLIDLSYFYSLHNVLIIYYRISAEPK